MTRGLVTSFTSTFTITAQLAVDVQVHANGDVDVEVNEDVDVNERGGAVQFTPCTDTTLFEASKNGAISASNTLPSSRCI